MAYAAHVYSFADTWGFNLALPDANFQLPSAEKVCERGVSSGVSHGSGPRQMWPRVAQFCRTHNKHQCAFVCGLRAMQEGSKGRSSGVLAVLHRGTSHGHMPRSGWPGFRPTGMTTPRLHRTQELDLAFFFN